MNKLKFFMGMLLFGSLWGFSETLIGSYLNDLGLQSGAIMTGFFALFLLVSSRIFYKQRGMQLGMGLIAGGLRLFNPFTGCHLCSAMAIMAEGAIFELIWYKISNDMYELKTSTMMISMGIFSAYILYVGGYIITQILTPVVSGVGFYIDNLIVILPKILASGIIAGLIGGITLPAALLAKKIDFQIKDKLYYPTTLGLSALCWLIILGNWILIGAN